MAWIPAVIAGVQALYGAYEGNKARQQAKDQDKAAIAAQKDQLAAFQPYGQSLMKSGQGNMDIVQQYLRRLASGDRGLTEQTLAPEINSMAGAQQNSVGAQRNLYPRGGMAASQAANLPYQLQGNINNLMFQSRPQAMSQLGQLGSNQSSLGLGALGQGAGLTNSMLNYGLQSRQQMFDLGQNTMSGVGNNLINSYLLYQMNRPQPTQSQLPVTTPNYPQNIMAPGPTNGTASSSNLYGKTLGGGTTPSSNSYNSYQPSGYSQFNNPYGQP